MKTMIYSILLYLGIFALFYPEHYKFLPISTIWIAAIPAIIFSIMYFFQHKVWSEVKFLCLLGIIILCVGIFASKVFNNGGDFGLANRGIQIITFSLFGVWVACMFVKVYKHSSVFKLLEILINIATFQAIVSIIFLLVPSIAELYRSFVVLDVFTLQEIDKLSQYRLLGIGDMRYATAAVNYGFMIWAILLLRHNKYGLLGKVNWYSITIITLLSLAGILSGRTFLIVFLLTIPYVYFLKGCVFKDAVKELFLTFFPVLVMGSVVFIYLFANNEQLVSWAFELFINMGNNGQIESESTNQLKDMYILPTTIDTWLFGDGRLSDQYGGFYMGSDVGYVRSIFYWGITGTIVYLFIQFKMVRKAISSSHDVTYRFFVYFIFIFFLIYWLKDLYSIEKLLCLFIIVQAMSNRINKKSKNRYYVIHNRNTSI